jgi:hypothetical protein
LIVGMVVYLTYSRHHSVTARLRRGERPVVTLPGPAPEPLGK